MSTLLQIENHIPFAAPIRYWIEIDETTLDEMVKQSRQFERAFLAWETVRKQRNPFFENGTGFEGYFVGTCHSPEEALEAILKLNRDILDRIHRLHRMDYGFQSRLMKTLTGDIYDPAAMQEWSAQLGAALGRLRAGIYYNEQASRFQTETYRSVYHLPLIFYRQKNDAIEQRYAVNFGSPRGGRVLVEPGLLKPREQDAWLVAEYVGRFGHPLVRQFLRSDRT
ncbi:hypothetical protein FBR01_16585 [Anaerolineae bacterium CFX8]|nr:hypothetical protein [Anaerolineae bacterium CFX8]